MSPLSERRGKANHLTVSVEGYVGTSREKKRDQQPMAGNREKAGCCQEGDERDHKKAACDDALLHHSTRRSSKDRAVW
eukprot:6354774-Ditylum_brightwellii.AAC.1